MTLHRKKFSPLDRVSNLLGKGDHVAVTIMMEDGLQLSYLGKNANISDVILTGHGLLASYVMLRTSNIQQQTNK